MASIPTPFIKNESGIFRCCFVYCRKFCFFSPLLHRHFVSFSLICMCVCVGVYESLQIFKPPLLVTYKQIAHFNRHGWLIHDKFLFLSFRTHTVNIKSTIFGCFGYLLFIICIDNVHFCRVLRYFPCLFSFFFFFPILYVDILLLF